MIDWSRYPNFSENEFRCACCGEARMNPTFLARLQWLRTRVGLPLTITSGYRCPDYNARVSSTGRNGPHTTGCAADIACLDQRKLIACASYDDFPGLGVGRTFTHLDTLTTHPRPNVWTY